MGCTSSTPNMASTNQNATENILEFGDDDGGLSIKEEDKVVSTSEENGKKEIKVLPCDTLSEPIQLDSNSKSIIRVDTSNLDPDKDIPTDKSDVLESDTKAKENERVQTGEKMSLEDVVEKVVELYVTEAVANKTPEIPEPTADIENSAGKTTNETDKISDKIDEIVSDPSEPQEELLEEALSPSQSTSSRATRWEALADIAAELPPSLTVDPLTGQIYALSK